MYLLILDNGGERRVFRISEEEFDKLPEDIDLDTMVFDLDEIENHFSESTAGEVNQAIADLTKN